MSPDFGKNNFVSSADSVGFLLALLIWLSSNGDGSEDIHNEVGPKHLDNIEWWMANGHSSQNCDKANNNIDGELELDELSHVVENSSSPFHRLVN